MLKRNLTAISDAALVSLAVTPNLDATSNWWGAADGPSDGGSVPEATSLSGDSVGINVDFSNHQTMALGPTTTPAVPAQCDTNPLPVACTGVTTANVNVRSGSSINDPEIGTLPVNTEVSILGRFIPIDGSPPWYAIEHPSPPAWVRSDLVTLAANCDRGSIPIVDDQGSPIPLPPVDQGECLASIGSATDNHRRVITVENIAAFTNANHQDQALMDAVFQSSPLLPINSLAVVTAIHPNRQYAQIEYLDSAGELQVCNQWIWIRNGTRLSNFDLIDVIQGAGCLTIAQDFSRNAIETLVTEALRPQDPNIESLLPFCLAGQ